MISKPTHPDGMSGIHYGEVFGKAFKEREGAKPYTYQCRLACGAEADPNDSDTLKRGASCQSQLIDIPTGLGKTAAVVFAWLWNRVLQPNVEARQTWPRRLVFCLPMRTLVEQTHENVEQWLKNISDNADELGLDASARAQLEWLKEHSPIVLMGGEEIKKWDIYPEKDAILIGTQDMLLSRALNRGYGMSRYRWPMHFGLLNNDALWILDETQLMGVSVETSAQLDGFRSRVEWSPLGACPTWWMSATLEASRLATVDHPGPAEGWPKIALSAPERSVGEVRQRCEAKKSVTKSAVTLSFSNKKDYPKQLAAFIGERHVPGTLTLVVVNRVSRAQEIYSALRDKKFKLDPARVALIHSRFRPVDRERHNRLLFGGGDRIVIATQAVEAGVDVSARLLVTELAPWSSLVQRFGRCNRRGDLTDAEVHWIDIQLKDEKDDLALPYAPDELKKSRGAMASLTDASPKSLTAVQVAEFSVIRPVIRRRDLIDLFDTTPDLCGQDLDISRYIRDGEDTDVELFWRDLSESGPTKDEAPAQREELCRVAVGAFRKFLKNTKPSAWIWNPLEEHWEKAERARPGAIYLLAVKGGGYSDEAGWTGEAKQQPTPYPPAIGANETYAGNRLTFIGQWQTLAQHTKEVVAELARIAADLALDPAYRDAIETAALWHDLGKAHPIFQKMLGGDPAQVWAKSDHRGGIATRDDIPVKGFRHELASAIAWLVAGPSNTAERDLVAYLLAAHHGRVRLSIRALPEENPRPSDPERLHARGIWDGDILPAVSLGAVEVPTVTLDLSFMQMGDGEHGPSWLARMIALRDRLGPFRLAYLETLLRAADMRASAAAEKAAIQP